MPTGEYIRTAKMKEQIRKTLTGRKLTTEHKKNIGLGHIGKVSVLKNKTYEQLYGKDKANIIQKKISVSNKKVIHTDTWNKKVSNNLKGNIWSIERRVNQSKAQILRFSKIKHPMTGKKRLDIVGDKNPNKRPEVKEKKRKTRLKQILKYGGSLQLGRNEKYILDELEKLFKLRIIRQHQVIGYVLDGYIPELNLAIEVDEPYHQKQKIKIYKDRN